MALRYFSSLFVALVLLGDAARSEPIAELTTQVRDAEIAFAKTMADRNLPAFESFLADDAVFFSPGALRGKSAIIAVWKAYFEGAQAPFAWQPAVVEVLESGALALSSGPVFDAQGKRTSTFNSVWRRNADGRWKVVFDKGSCVCDQ